jgi:hypothetical protein
VARRACGAANLADCYCGSAAGAKCLSPRAADGPCKAEIEAGLETTDPAEIATRFADTTYGGGVALSLLGCAQESCASECFRKQGGILPGHRGTE